MFAPLPTSTKTSTPAWRFVAASRGVRILQRGLLCNGLPCASIGAHERMESVTGIPPLGTRKTGKIPGQRAVYVSPGFGEGARMSLIV